MNTRYPLVLAFVLILAGCSGGVPTGNPQDNPQTSQQSNVACSDVSLEKFAPPAPSGWTKGELYVGSASQLSNRIEYLNGYDQGMQVNYTSPDGATFGLIVTKWKSPEEAEVVSENSIYIGSRVVFESYMIDMIPMGIASTNKIPKTKELISSVQCVDESRISTQDFNITVSEGNYTTPEFSVNLSEPTKPSDLISASYKSVDYEVGSDIIGTYVNVTVVGEFENTSLSVSVGESGALITEDDLADGKATARVYLGATSTEPTTYTLQIKPAPISVGETYTEEITIGGADLSISNLNIETEIQQYIEGHQISLIQFDLTNTGSVGITVNTLQVMVNGETGQSLLYEDVGGGETIEITNENYMMWPALSTGENTVTVQILAENDVVAEATQTITV